MTTYPDLSTNNRFGVNLATGNFSGTITNGGTAQTLCPATPTRKSVSLQNVSAGDLWVNENGAAVVGGANSYKIPAGESYYTSWNGAISIIGATTGQAFSAREE